MSFNAGFAFFTGPLEAEGNSTIECEEGATLNFGGGAKHKIGGKGMVAKGAMQFEDGEVEFAAALVMSGARSRLNITAGSKV